MDIFSPTKTKSKYLQLMLICILIVIKYKKYRDVNLHWVRSLGLVEYCKWTMDISDFWVLDDKN